MSGNRSGGTRGRPVKPKGGAEGWTDYKDYGGMTLLTKFDQDRAKARRGVIDKHNWTVLDRENEINKRKKDSDYKKNQPMPKAIAALADEEIEGQVRGQVNPVMGGSPTTAQSIEEKKRKAELSGRKATVLG